MLGLDKGKQTILQSPQTAKAEGSSACTRNAAETRLAGLGAAETEMVHASHTDRVLLAVTQLDKEDTAKEASLKMPGWDFGL